ncbi:MAG: YARHG domain-containing protein [Eggerthellaceae bacterium]
MSDYELYLARNEVFARHGRIFKNSDLQEYLARRVGTTPLYARGVQRIYVNANEKVISSAWPR